MRRKCMREFSAGSRSAVSARLWKPGGHRCRWGSTPMGSKRRACVIGVGYLGLAALLALLQTAGAAPQQPLPKPAAPVPPAADSPTAEPDSQFTEAITLPTDRQVKKRLEAARDEYIQNEAWSEAAQLLQRILDSKEDV